MIFNYFKNFNFTSLVPFFFIIFFTFSIITFNEQKPFRIIIMTSILIIIFSFLFALNAFFYSDWVGYIYSFFTIFIAILNLILGVISGLNYLKMTVDENEESKLKIQKEDLDY